MNEHNDSKVLPAARLIQSSSRQILSEPPRESSSSSRIYMITTATRATRSMTVRTPRMTHVSLHHVRRARLGFSEVLAPPFIETIVAFKDISSCFTFSFSRVLLLYVDNSLTKPSLIFAAASCVQALVWFPPVSCVLGIAGVRNFNYISCIYFSRVLLPTADCDGDSICAHITRFGLGKFTAKPEEPLLNFKRFHLTWNHL